MVTVECERRGRDRPAEHAGDRADVVSGAEVDRDAAAEHARVVQQRPGALAGEVAAGRVYVIAPVARPVIEWLSIVEAGVGVGVGVVADRERVAAGAGLDVEVAVDLVERADEGQVVVRDGAVQDGLVQHLQVAVCLRERRRERSEVGGVGDEHHVVAGAGVEHRVRQRAADVEAVVARAEEDREALRGGEAVVVDAVHAGEVGGGRAGRRVGRSDGEAHGQAVKLAPEADQEVAAVLPDEHALGAPRVEDAVAAGEAAARERPAGSHPAAPGTGATAARPATARPRSRRAASGAS